MSAVYGIASFADGFVKGRQIRDERQDKKDQKERQKRLDELTFSQDARDAEAHKARMGAYDREATAFDREQARIAREEADKEELRAAWENAYATDPALGANPPADGGQSASGPTSPAAQGVAASLGLPMPQSPNHTAAAFDALGGIPGAAPQSLGAVPAPAGPTVAAAAKLGTSFEQQGRQGQPKQPTFQDWRRMDGQQRYDAGLPVSEIGGQLHFNRFGVGMGLNDPRTGEYTGPTAESFAPDYGHDWGGSLGADAGEVGKRGIAALGALNEGVINKPFRKVANTVNSGANAVLDYATGGAAPEIPMFTGDGWETKTPTQIGADADASHKRYKDGLAELSRLSNPAGGEAPPPQAEIAKGPVRAPAGGGKPADKAALASAAAEAMAGATTPALDAAAKAATASAPSVMGVKPNQKVTPQQVERASTAFTEHYVATGAPLVIQTMMKQGKYKEAIEFQKFLESEQARKGMKSWAKAAFAANIGDMDGFAEEVMNAYNSAGYFDDNTTIVKEASGFTYGKDGSISGAKITFKDGDTGTTFEQVFSDPNDLVRMGITLLAPENAFEYYMAQTDKKNEADIAAAAKIPDPAKAKEALDKRIDEVAKLLFEKSQESLTGATPLTYAEAREQATIELTRPQGGGAAPLGLPDDLPVMRRPTN